LQLREVPVKRKWDLTGTTMMMMMIIITSTIILLLSLLLSSVDTGISKPTTLDKSQP
jgi:hypothetical protein